VGEDEETKRRKEWWWTISIGVVFLVLSWAAFRLFVYSQNLPFEYSIFFFGLVNFNIIIFLLLIFLIFRNIVKNFSEREKSFAGRSLKSKLIAAFVAFSFVPTTLMFLVSVFYINSSFDKWFNQRTSYVLKSSLEVMNQYYASSKKRNYHFAKLIIIELEKKPNVMLQKFLAEKGEVYKLDSIEFYPGLLGKRSYWMAKELSNVIFPEVSLDFKKKGVLKRSEASYLHHFGEGNLVRVIAPIKWNGKDGALVVSSFIPLSLISKMDNITQAYDDYKDSTTFSYPLKSIYLIILILMTTVILLGATWFGFYLAKQLSIPLELLAQAARRVSDEDYQQVQIKTGSPEINDLVENFNKMSVSLERNRNEITKSNQHLKEYNRYIDVLLSNVTTGVVSLSNSGSITMINRYAARLLNIDSKEFIGKRILDVLPEKYINLFHELNSNMNRLKTATIQKQIRVEFSNKSILFQISISMLRDEKGDEMGKIIVFDDLTMLVNAQRAAAWTEVAKRIAHEIKNPLTPISLAAQRLQRKFGSEIKDPAFSECTTMIIEQVDGLKNLVNEFSHFARMPQTQTRLSNINATVEAAVNMYKTTHSHIKFEILKDDKCPDFLFDDDQMKRAFTNLFENAIDALKETDEPTVKVQIEYVLELKIVRVIIEDNGPGIEDKLRERIFEPYVTSKTHGTGLGLAIVKRTVEDHNGFIRAFSSLNKGTKIVIELPDVGANIKKEFSNFESVTLHEKSGDLPV
jgi:two-component system nitrogen regulation sensor histidine kinase NtrY